MRQYYYPEEDDYTGNYEGEPLTDEENILYKIQKLKRFGYSDKQIIQDLKNTYKTKKFEIGKKILKDMNKPNILKFDTKQAKRDTQKVDNELLNDETYIKKIINKLDFVTKKKKEKIEQVIEMCIKNKIPKKQIFDMFVKYEFSPSDVKYGKTIYDKKIKSSNRLEYVEDDDKSQKDAREKKIMQAVNACKNAYIVEEDIKFTIDNMYSFTPEELKFAYDYIDTLAKPKEINKKGNVFDFKFAGKESRESKKNKPKGYNQDFGKNENEQNIVKAIDQMFNMGFPITKIIKYYETNKPKELNLAKRYLNIDVEEDEPEEEQNDTPSNINKEFGKTPKEKSIIEVVNRLYKNGTSIKDIIKFYKKHKPDELDDVTKYLNVTVQINSRKSKAQEIPVVEPLKKTPPSKILKFDTDNAKNELKKFDKEIIGELDDWYDKDKEIKRIGRKPKKAKLLNISISVLSDKDGRKLDFQSTYYSEKITKKLRDIILREVEKDINKNIFKKKYYN